MKENLIARKKIGNTKPGEILRVAPNMARVLVAMRLAERMDAPPLAVPEMVASGDQDSPPKRRGRPPKNVAGTYSRRDMRAKE